MSSNVPTPARPAVAEHARTLVRSVVRPARAACFWLAVALPLLHVPLFLHGLSTPGEVGAFGALLVANGLAIALGGGYAPGGAATDRSPSADAPATDGQPAD